MTQLDGKNFLSFLKIKLHLHTISTFQFSLKHLQTPFLYKVSKKTDGTFTNHVNMAQKFNLSSTFKYNSS